MLQCGTDDKQLKIELLSQWKLEAEFRNKLNWNNNRKKQNKVKLSSSTCNAFDFSSRPSCLLANLTSLEERQVRVVMLVVLSSGKPHLLGGEAGGMEKTGSPPDLKKWVGEPD